MDKRTHYLGLEYCKPNEAGLYSTATAVGKSLGVLLDGLSGVNEWNIEHGELTDMLWKIRLDLITKLRADGWIITIPKNKYIVKPPRSKAAREKAVAEFKKSMANLASCNA